MSAFWRIGMYHLAALVASVAFFYWLTGGQ